MRVTPYRSFWIPEEFVKTYERLKQILRREGKTVGGHLRNHIARYVEIHDPGNPQTSLVSYSDGGKVTLAQLEGRIRERFRSRAAGGKPVTFRDIVLKCKEDVVDVSAALAMAERVYAWLRSRGVKVWR